MKEIKREFLMFYAYYDRTGIAKHLEEMAAQGWLLEKVGSLGWQYRRTEPRKLRFTVTYFPDASRFDPYPSAGLETYRDLCEAAGWILAADSAQIQIFYNEDPHAIPIETDPAADLSNIHRAMKRSFLSSYWSLLALSLMQVGMHLWRALSDPVSFLSSPTNLASSLGYLPLLVLVSIELIRYYLWYRRAGIAAKNGEVLPELRSFRALSCAVLIFSCAALFLMFTASTATSGMTLLLVGILLYMLLMILLTYLASNAMKHLRFNAWGNRIVTYAMIVALTVGMMGGMIALILHTDLLDPDPAPETYEYKGISWDVYHDELPLSIEDLTETDYTEWSKKLTVNASPLLTHMEARQRPRMDALEEPELEYELVVVHWAPLYNLCKNDYIRWLERDHDKIPPEFWEEYRPVNAEAWDAVEAYQRYNAGEPRNDFLICWSDRMAEISFDWEWTITEDLITVTAEKLKNAA